MTKDARQAAREADPERAKAAANAPRIKGGPADGPDPEKTAAAPPAEPVTAINGVGPALAERLKALGVETVDQLATLTDDEAAKMKTVDAVLGDALDRIRALAVAQVRDKAAQPPEKPADAPPAAAAAEPAPAAAPAADIDQPRGRRTAEERQARQAERLTALGVSAAEAQALIDGGVPDPETLAEMTDERLKQLSAGGAKQQAAAAIIGRTALRAKALDAVTPKARPKTPPQRRLA